MDVNAPISLVTASYSSRDDAVEDFNALWRARNDGAFHHTAVAALTRDADGSFHVDRNANTAKYLGWGGALLGGALFVVQRSVGLEILSQVGVSGAGTIVGHLRRKAAPATLARAAGVLEHGRWSVVALVVNRHSAATMLSLERAAELSPVDMMWGDLQEELCQDSAQPHSSSVIMSG
jgi:hypothetical protein